MNAKLKQNEEVIFKTTPHWIDLIIPGIISIVIIAVSIILYISIDKAGIIFFLIGLAGAVYFLYKYIERRRDLWIVTNLRVIDEEGIFSVSCKESPLDKINNVTYFQSLWGRMLGFGDVEIQTAAEMGATTYHLIASPRELKDAITSAQENYKQNQVNTQAQKLSEALNNFNTGDSMECPYCAEIIKAKAKICRYCGRELYPDTGTKKL
jgi:uncharacterized membrane protein YdbT with pleckstrin-like domain